MHDETHIHNVMTIMLMLLNDSKSDLTRDEYVMLLMNACCHDIGMSVTDEEKEYLHRCPDYIQIYLSNHHKDYVITYGNGVNEKPNITDEIIQHFIRTNHHKRGYDKLQEYSKSLFKIFPIFQNHAIIEEKTGKRDCHVS